MIIGHPIETKCLEITMTSDSEMKCFLHHSVENHGGSVGPFRAGVLAASKEQSFAAPWQLA